MKFTKTKKQMLRLKDQKKLQREIEDKNKKHEIKY